LRGTYRRYICGKHALGIKVAENAVIVLGNELQVQMLARSKISLISARLPSIKISQEYTLWFYLALSQGFLWPFM